MKKNVTKKKEKENKKAEVIRCTECANHYGEVSNYMVYCKKLGFYRSLAARTCEHFVELKKQN